jgi:hypothetical protein
MTGIGDDFFSPKGSKGVIVDLTMYVHMYNALNARSTQLHTIKIMHMPSTTVAAAGNITEIPNTILLPIILVK